MTSNPSPGDPLSAESKHAVITAISDTAAEVDAVVNAISEYILVVDDSPTQRKHMASVLESDGFRVRVAATGPAAIKIVGEAPPVVVVSDVEMPEMSGLQLVQTLRGTHPSVPVVLTTSRGSEDIAAEALRIGAASYVPKRLIAKSLCQVVRQVLAATEALRSAKATAKFAVRSGIELRIGNEETLVAKVISRLEMTLIELGGFDEGCRMQVAMALDEAILNAIVHGNLEVPSSLREIDGGESYFALIEERKQAEPYRSRGVTISLDATPEMATFVITDEGPGYDPNCLADATDEEHVEGLGGRGMLMIGAFMDEIQHNPCGNQITMIKRTESC